MNREIKREVAKKLLASIIDVYWWNQQFDDKERLLRMVEESFVDGDDECQSGLFSGRSFGTSPLSSKSLIHHHQQPSPVDFLSYALSQASQPKKAPPSPTDCASWAPPNTDFWV